jgi:hypothetical protein
MVVLKVVRDVKERPTWLSLYSNTGPPRWTGSAGDTVVRMCVWVGRELRLVNVLRHDKMGAAPVSYSAGPTNV